jgi:hypothetical protein
MTANNSGSSDSASTRPSGGLRSIRDTVTTSPATRPNAKANRYHPENARTSTAISANALTGVSTETSTILAASLRLRTI